MMYHHESRGAGSARLRWLLGALLPLALTGCGERYSGQATRPAPDERVAGERQVQGDEETRRVLQQSGLPATFAFGGRTWTATRVHWPGGDAGGVASDTDRDARTPAAVPGGFVPVANLTVQGHPIYRRSGLNEAVTDNIYLRAMIPGGTGTAPSGAAGTGAGTVSGRLAYVEYDASGETMEQLDLAQVLSAARMARTFQHGGRTWTAREMQVYDPDVFADLTPLPQKVAGFAAYQGDDRDDLFIQGDVVSMSTAPAQGAGTTAVTTYTGPVFVRYEAEARR